ncbi:hypothetical protein QF038_001609 [Pseudarthrobacter sp. W1I19]|uniref:hypothetical protein n=1 Tax=Pseudarthrobacter sp. W1I19 TaxID=3042288 RepID=UPI0027823294|nr:hypothetical protein [Pseudarthrobacter sp. W1I19]MDQ0923101.1 hypothetical protein [Pseudarthrobacter sp. W1I19]
MGFLDPKPLTLHGLDSAAADKIADPASATRGALNATYESKGAAAPKLDKSEAATTYIPRSESAARVLRRAPANRASSGWTIPAQANKDAASTPDYTADAYFGDRCLRLITTGTAAHVYATRTMDTTFDATDCNVRITIKVTDYDFTAIQVVVGNSSATLTSSATIGFTAGGASAASYALQKDRWIVLDIPQSKFAATRRGPPSSSSASESLTPPETQRRSDCTAWISSRGTPLGKTRTA